MVLEAVKVEGQSKLNATDFTVPDATAVPKYTLMKMSGARIAGPSNGQHPFAGISSADKKADDGQLNLALHKDGIFKLYVTSGAALVEGGLVKLSGANMVGSGVLEANILTGDVVGQVLEPVDSGVATVVEVDIGRTG